MREALEGRRGQPKSYTGTQFFFAGPGRILIFREAKNKRPLDFWKIFLILFLPKTRENIPLPVNNETISDCRLFQIPNQGSLIIYGLGVADSRGFGHF